MSDVLLIVMRPDRQDFEGTGITARVAKELDVPRVAIVVNKSPTDFDPADVRARVESAYGCEVLAVLFHSDDLMRLGSEGIFVVRHPGHDLATAYRQLAEHVLPTAG
jgi:MinD-like ATPase involved in chromosome partitioning or flagellar assembly